ncbi:uncharacterized protein BX663DRAFT_526664 [Cokeromyces recurvatus]|uniref:uncharacterized protein n=1 Tax=Cokeromyces recurvatus TaxID=90255 RepID=UPI00221F69A9|nr:uncharacterized protein BX663DRAFT_526664 [Cokeromyces recurvatus]KAI7897980.1 hypothetical protein BX663DRAFT_526664 [Cokeromyces recurvatus]
MSFASCFWALLSLEKFKFIYLPKYIDEIEISFGITIGDILRSRSLLDFIHPDELSLAATDLLNFVQTTTLAGAITRCRLRSIKSLAYEKLKDDNEGMDNNNESTNWVIADVVTYTATDKVILAFFHTDMSDQNIACCGSERISTNAIYEILNILQQYHSLQPITRYTTFRLFQIYDTKEKQLLISWPSYFNKDKNPYHNSNTVIQNFDRLPLLYNNNINQQSYRIQQEEIKFLLDLTNTFTLQEIERKIAYTTNFSTSLTGVTAYATCTHHTHSTSTVMTEPFGLCEVERIIIIYGSLTFSLFQITSLDTNKNHPLSFPSLVTMKTNHRQEQHSKAYRISKINEILNNDNIKLPLPTVSAQLLANHNLTTTTTIATNTKEHTTGSETNNRSSLLKTWRNRFGIQEKKCENCQTSTSPEWRRGPNGHKR